jgi:hypothetical protein
MPIQSGFQAIVPSDQSMRNAQNNNDNNNNNNNNEDDEDSSNNNFNKKKIPREFTTMNSCSRFPLISSR